MKREICISLDEEIFKNVEEKRGTMIPRSRMIADLIKKGLASEQVPNQAA